MTDDDAHALVTRRLKTSSSSVSGTPRPRVTPENFITEGIEVTTGPLGMGICNAVGLAMIEKHLAGRFNKPDCEIVDHYTYCIMGDGCNMEGMSGEGRLSRVTGVSVS